MRQTSLINKRSAMIVITSLVASFLMVVIPHFNIHDTSWISPLPAREDKMFEIKPKLEKNPNKFQIKKGFIPQADASSDYDKAEAYAVLDFDTGDIIASKNISKRLPMASLTKLMTAVVAMDLASLDSEFTVSKRAAEQIPTKVALQAGEVYLLENLIEEALISSANDSAQTINDGVDEKYGQAVFVEAMNEKAKFLGLKNTSFANAEGLDDTNHYSSAEDLSILAHYALSNYPFISRIVSREVLDLTNNWQDKRFYLQNWNGLIGVYPGVEGVKIGNTDKAGDCTIVLSERSGKRVLAVVLGAPGTVERDLWASELLDLGFSKVANLAAVNVTEAQLRQKYASWKYFN